MSIQFGILTYHNANNYGAVLQAYALQRFLQDQFGDDQVEVVDYKCEGVRKQKRLKYIIKGQNPLMGLLHWCVAKSRIRKIDSFCKKHMRLSRHITDRQALTDIVEQYRFLVSGSDQVWNRKWTGGEDTYLQDFHECSEKKVSYAASFGVPDLPNEWLKDYQRLLSTFAHLSVREEAGRRIVSEKLGLQAVTHLDPTLLLKRSEWVSISKRVKPLRPYVLVYMVPYQESTYRTAERIAKEHQLDLYTVSKSLKHPGRGYRGTAEVGEVLSLFSNAECVVTNSFHGTAFSIIFQRRFVVNLGNKWGYNIRSAELISRCGIADLTNKPEYIECYHVDWDQVEQALNRERQRTREYFSAIASPN